MLELTKWSNKHDIFKNYILYNYFFANNFTNIMVTR